MANDSLLLEYLSLIPYRNTDLDNPTQVKINNIYCLNYDFEDYSLDFYLELIKMKTTIIVNKDLRAKIFMNQESEINDLVYYSVSENFDKEFESFKSLFSITKKNIKVNISLNTSNGDTGLSHELYSKWKECSFVNKVMSAPIVTGDAALRCIDSGCDDLIIGYNNDYIEKTGIEIPILNSLDEIVNLLNKVDSTLLEEVNLIANLNVTNPIVVSKLLAFGANKVMLLEDLKIATESSNWDMPSLLQAIKLKSRNPVKVISDQLINFSYPCQRIIEEYNQDLKEILFCLGVNSTDELRELEINYIKTL